MRSILVDGVERADITRVESLRITNRAGDDFGTGIGELILDDPLGELIDDANRPDIKKTWLVTEDATASPTVLGFGRIGDYETQRHSPNDYLDRQVDWKLILEGPNIELSGFDVHGQTRPVETDWERFQWVAATYLNGSPRATTVLDATTYAPNTNTVDMEAKTYNQCDVTDVIRDCMEQADKICFVTADAEIFYDQKDSTAYTSSISISDRPADVNQTSVFEPIWDQGPALTSEGHTYASRLRMAYGSEQSVLVGPDGSEADHDYWVGRTNSTDPLSAAQATAIAEGELAFRAKGVRTYSLSLLLANDQVDLIKHGQRIQIKARAAVDADNAYVYRRIAQLQWEVESPEYYWAHLQLDQPLTAHAKNQRGQVNTNSQSDLISPCPCIETFNRVVAADDLGVSDLNNNGWIIDSVTGATGEVEVDGSVAVIHDTVIAHLPVIGVPNSRFEMVFRCRRTAAYDGNNGHLILGVGHGSVADGVAHAYITIPVTSAGGATWNFNGNLSFREEGNSGQINSGDELLITNAKGSDTGPWLDVQMLVTGNTATANISIGSPGAGMIFTQTPANNYEATSGLIDHIYLQSAVGSDPLNTNAYWEIDQIRVIAGIWCCGTIALPGQFITTQTVGYGNGTADYVIPSAAYVPGSLRVWVDGLEQTQGLTESDPSTGAFTLGFTPDDTELITASYRVG